MLLPCSTVNISLRHKDDMTFTIHFTLKHLCFLSLSSRSLLHSFFTFASKSSLPWQLGSIYEKSLLSPCFVHYGCFSHLYTRIQNRSLIWWQRLIQLKARKQGWIILRLNLWRVWLNVLDSKINNSYEVIIHLVTCFSIDPSSFCGQNLERCAMLLWLKL